MTETHCRRVAIDLILHFRFGRIFVGCCFLRLKLETCWLILSSKRKDVLPMYWKSAHIRIRPFFVEWKAQHLYGRMEGFFELRKKFVEHKKNAL